MSGFGCALVVLLIALAIAWAIANARNAKIAHQTEQRDRGNRVADLMARLAAEPTSERISGEVLRILQKSPIEYFPELTAETGWFYRARPALSALWRLPSDRLVDSYFQTFTFPAGQQQAVLSWLAEMLQAAGTDPGALEKFQKLADQVLVAGSADEARWLYARTLEAVGQNGANTHIKALALHFGRLSYAFDRPGRVPTLYDEQAIANDIAVRAS